MIKANETSCSEAPSIALNSFRVSYR